MTTQQLHLFNGLAIVVLVVVAILTRATARRIAGALAGGAAAGVVALGIVALGEEVGWWHMAITWEPYFLTLLWIDFALCAFIFLITWRIARRFGWRGLAVVVIVAAVIGPPRDYWYMAAVPGVGRLRAGDRTRPGDLRDLRPDGARGARGDAAGRRSRPRKSRWPDGRGRPPNHPLQLTRPAMLLSGTSRLPEAGRAAELYR